MKHPHGFCDMYPYKKVALHLLETEPKWIELDILFSTEIGNKIPISEQWKKQQMAFFLQQQEFAAKSKKSTEPNLSLFDETLKEYGDSQVPLEALGEMKNRDNYFVERQQLFGPNSSKYEDASLRKNEEKSSGLSKTELSFQTNAIKNDNNIVEAANIIHEKSSSNKTMEKDLKAAENKSNINETENTNFDPFKLLKSEKYFDVIFCTNDSKKVFGHRCILFTFSDIFEAFFNESNDIPIEIEVDFTESIVSRAIEYCYGKIDRIQGFEVGLIEFAETYSNKGLKKACLKSLMHQTLTTENISHFVKIAFEQNCTALKQKCLKFIFENIGEKGA